VSAATDDEVREAFGKQVSRVGLAETLQQELCTEVMLGPAMFRGFSCLHMHSLPQAFTSGCTLCDAHAT
jgi:hypothetical protein